MDKEILIALISFAGVSLGALFSGVGYFLKVSSQRTKHKKKVLFHLLEIRLLIKSEYADINELSMEFFNYCDSYLEKKGITGKKVVSEQLRELIEVHFLNLINATKPVINSDFISSYENAISLLSEDAPVLAYKLKGRDFVKKVLSAQKDYIQNFQGLNVFENQEQLQKAVSNKMVQINHSVIENLIIDIDEDIRQVGKSCGIITWFSCKPLLKQTSKPRSNLDYDEFNTIMDDIWVVITDGVSKLETIEVDEPTMTQT